MLYQTKQGVKNKTLLGVGPMSVNCVDAAIELANQFQTPLILIASRRQIDHAALGGGYVNRWTTDEFCRYVKNKDHGNFILLARDHGGPWQSEIEVEKRMNFQEAMESAKSSYSSDITAGMNIIHLDPGRNELGQATITLPEFIKRTKELISYCYAQAEQFKKPITIEVGTDEGDVGSASAEETEAMLSALIDFCRSEKLPIPGFMVAQTGTKVMEMRNVGKLDNLIRQSKHILYQDPQLKNLISLCEREGLFLKEHNADYLSDEALAWHPEVGIHSANVAPEFGVAETRAFLALLKEFNLIDLRERFLEMAFQSCKWKKWMLEETSASDYERSVISGHYLFSTPEFIEIKEEIKIKCKEKGFDLDSILKQSIKSKILRYMKNFNLL